MSRRRVVTICAFLVLAGLSAIPIAAIAQQDAKAALEVPPAFRNLSAGTFVEQYIATTLLPLRRVDTDRNGLDAGDIERFEGNAGTRARVSRVTKILASDLDGDGAVTLDEVRQTEGRRIAGESDSQAARRDLVVARTMQFDRNGDGTITFAEMLRGEDGTADAVNPFLRSAESLLALDPNKDGRLTGEELIGLAQGWFAAADGNGDGYLAREEVAAFQRIAPPPPRPVRVEECILPKPDAKDLVVAYGTYGGSAFSSVALAGQDRETSTSRVVIEAGAQPIYLVLSALEAMIWRIEGATGRLARVVVLSRSMPTPGKPAAGVIGIPADKLIFINPRECKLTLQQEGTTDWAVAVATLAKALDRPADVVAAKSEVEGVSLPSRATFRQGRERPATPPGFDEEMWEKALRYSPDGIVMIDPQTVVSPNPVEPYVVLPQQAGLAQLIGEGSIVPIPGANDLRIVKPLKRFPAGLNGAHSVRFLLGKGVPLPPGDPGHSCVVSEETGRPLTKGPRCG